MRLRLVVAALLLCAVISIEARGTHSARQRSRARAERKREVESKDGLRTQVWSVSKGGDGSFQEKQWDTGDEGGSTSVVLANRNDVEAVNDHTKERLAQARALAEQKQEAKNKDDYRYQLRSRTEAGRKENERLDEAMAKKNEEQLQKQLQATQQRIAENAIKRQQAGTTEEQAAKTMAQQAEQGQKAQQSAQLEAEAGEKKQQEEEQKKWTEQDRKFQIVRGPIKPVFKTVIASPSRVVSSNNAFTYSLWINPTAKSTVWSNILQKGDNKNDRSPGIWFYPNSFRLHIRSLSTNGANPGCDPEAELTVGAWTHVTITHSIQGINVYYNGGNVCPAPQVGGPVMNTGSLWSGNSYDTTAQCRIADVRFYDKELTQEDIAPIMKARRFNA